MSTRTIIVHKQSHSKVRKHLLLGDSLQSSAERGREKWLFLLSQLMLKRAFRFNPRQILSKF